MPEPSTSPPPDDPRVSQRVFTVAEAAAWLTVPRTTFTGWLPLVLTLPARRGEPSIPFLGLVEGYVLGSLRRAGARLHRLRPALDRMEQELGLAHPLAHDRLATDGAEVLYDFGARLDPEGIRELVAVRAGRRLLAPAVAESLSRVRYAPDGWADQLELPGYAQAQVVVGPTLGRGRPVLVRSRVPIEDVVGRWITGDSIADLAEGFGLRGAEVEDVVRAATRRCAATD